MKTSFREATADDCGLLAALANAAFDPRYGEGWTATQLMGTLAQPTAWGEIVTLTDAKTAAGFTLSRIAADEAELLLVAIEPKWRQYGFGGMLMMRAIDAARARGASVMHLEVRLSNVAAIRLYDRHEFSEIGRRKAYYRGPNGEGHDAITMRRQITG